MSIVHELGRFVCFAVVTAALAGCTAEAEPPPQAPAAAQSPDATATNDASEHVAKTGQKLLAADDETPLYTFDNGVSSPTATTGTSAYGSGSAAGTTSFPGYGKQSGAASLWSEVSLTKDACNFAKKDSEKACTDSFSYLTWSHGKVLATLTVRSSCFVQDDFRECGCETSTACMY